MPAIRDESVAVLAPPQRRARRAGCGDRRLDRPPRRRQARTARPRSAAESGRARRPIWTRSAMTIMRAEAAATIFSRSSAPPPPLIRLRSGAISSAPSTVRSSSGVSSSVVSGMPQRSASACGRLRGRHRDRRRDRRARARRGARRNGARSSRCRARAACPARTKSSARAAAARFWASASMACGRAARFDFRRLIAQACLALIGRAG